MSYDSILQINRNICKNAVPGQFPTFPEIEKLNLNNIPLYKNSNNALNKSGTTLALLTAMSQNYDNFVRM